MLFPISARALLDQTIRAAEIAGRGWERRCALLLLAAIGRKEASTDFRLYFQSMGIAKSGIAMIFARKGAQGLFWLAIVLAALPYSAAQEKGSRDKASFAQARFAARVEGLLGAAPVDKGEWGLLVVDAESGATLYEKNSNEYFSPASNMKLLTTALALDTLGPEYKFRTTVETNGPLAADGTLSGDLILVGRGDPNLSNRKFPYETKEEFEGPPEKALAELADAVAARGVKEIAGDVVGDDSYFPRERYPDGWEIDDMVWEYGAAISAIVVDDNTVTLTLTPGEKASGAVTAVVEPATREFAVKNEVTTTGAREKPDLRLTREPGGGTVVVSGVMPARWMVTPGV